MSIFLCDRCGYDDHGCECPAEPDTLMGALGRIIVAVGGSLLIFTMFLGLAAAQ